MCGLTRTSRKMWGRTVAAYTICVMLHFSQHAIHTSSEWHFEPSKLQSARAAERCTRRTVLRYQRDFTIAITLVQDIYNVIQLSENNEQQYKIKQARHQQIYSSSNDVRDKSEATRTQHVSAN